jgi:hypothetical protein
VLEKDLIASSVHLRISRAHACEELLGLPRLSAGNQSLDHG